MAIDIEAYDLGQAGATLTLGQKVYFEIRKRILSGEWLPGSRITLRGLSAELNTSVQPVRDAITRLNAEGILDVKPNSSVMIPPVDKAKMDEMWAVRIVLESEAARLSASRLTEADFAELDETMDVTRTHHRTGGSRAERVRAAQKMAVLLARKSGSAIIAEQIEILRARSAPYYAAAMQELDMADQEFTIFSIRMQQETVNALKKRDADNACRLRAADLYIFQQYIYRRLGLSDEPSI